MRASRKPLAQKRTHGAAAPQDRKEQPDWAELLVEAVTKPGIISAAYNRFWQYSMGNQLLAAWQCAMRRIELGPIHTFKGWSGLGRHVRRGEKAITLCMPVQVKRKVKDQKIEEVRVGDGAERQLTGPGGEVPTSATSQMVTVFTYKPHWFALAQTEGADYVPVDVPEWSEAEALHSLHIDRVPFRHPDGNCQGYAAERRVAVSPIAALPHKTLFHELAHVLLGHTEEGNTLDDHDRTPRNLREVEAEAVAYICCESLNLAGAPESRGYLQHWLGNQNIPERSAQRIFKAADAILKAGRRTSDGQPADT